jgi:ABC-type sugar transport system substrate-binding protein
MNIKKLIGILLVLMLIVALPIFSEGKAEREEGEKELVFGNIAWKRSDVWNSYSIENFNWVAEKFDVQTATVDAQAQTSRAVSAMEDLISRGVDGISVFTITPELDVRLAKMANEAGIPVTFENSKPGEGDYDYISVVACQYEDIGYAAGKYISENYAGSKMFYVMGQPGMNITERYQEGLHRALEEYDTVELVGTQPTDWGAEKAMNVTQNAIQAGKEFDVIFANNEQMAGGVVNALQDAGMFEEVDIVATGGGPHGMEMLKNGEIDATMSAPVSVQGMATFLVLYNYIVKGEEPPQKFIPVPVIPVTQENVDEAITWEPSQQVYDYTVNYLKELAEN